MNFQIDRQTIKDLQLFSTRKNDPSVFAFFNRAETKGGQELLYQIFDAPSNDKEFLENRTSEIKLFHENKCFLKLNPRNIDFIEYYLILRRVPLKANLIDATYDGLSNKFNPDNDYFVITESILHICQLLLDLRQFIVEIKSFALTETLKEHLDEISEFLSSKTIVKLLEDPPEKMQDLTYSQINKFDHHFRVKEKESFRNLLTIVYEIDFLQSMSRLLDSDGLSLPTYTNSTNPVLSVSEAFHPFLQDPVKCSFEFSENCLLCFVTGPNMSGKSTFLKTMGLLVYISHLGIPVPARSLTTTIYDGIFSTINLSDDLNLGYSHFYSEVNRVKEIALKLNSDRKLVVIFDELFRGTNVKDAFDASLKIISTLAQIKDNFFFISTHILEVAENLTDNRSIIFKCFESEFIDQKPVYDFKIKNGISKERVGMQILEKENVIKILDDLIKRQKNV
jgi:DNA mismatch repair protein MutS